MILKPKKPTTPIFFSCDDNYIPWLSVALRSLIDNTTKENNYVVHILNNGLKMENEKKIRAMQTENVKIKFVNVSKKIMPIIENLGLRDYYTVAIYFRIFIASMFPQYKKAVYLDCDIVVLNDIAKLCNSDLHGNILGVINDQVVEVTEPFFRYVKYAVGVDHERYFNSGVMVMDLKKFREEHIERKFVEILTTHNFDLVAPDQDYLNFLCKDRVEYLDKSWNKQCMKDGYKGEVNLIHYNYFKKPWNDHYVKYRKYFWDYCKKTPFYDYAVNFLANFTPEQRLAGKNRSVELIVHANEIVDSGKNFYSVFEEPFLNKIESVAPQEEGDFLYGLSITSPIIAG